MTSEQQRPRYPRLSVTPPAPIPFTRPYPSYPTPSHHSSTSTSSSSSSLSSPFPFSPSTISTPSKRRNSSAASPSLSFTSLLLLLLSLRSLYSLLPFLRSSPSSFSLFPFSFLVSFFSFALTTLSFSRFPSHPPPDPNQPPLLSLKTLTLALKSPSHLRPLAAKSLLLSLLFLLRFQALRSCGTAATILADFSGGLAAKSLSEKQYGGGGSTAYARRARVVRGFAALITSFVLLSYGWNRIGCSPLSSSRGPRNDDCVRVLPMLLPFLSGFLGFYERSSANWGSLRHLGRKRVRWLSLGFTTVMLFFPAIASVLATEGGNDISVGNLGWPLLNTVIFGVVLSENYSEEKSVLIAKDINREFLVTYFCTLVLELFYFPQLSLPGFLFCGLLLWISVNQLGSSSFNYIELGNSHPSESIYAMIMNPVHHILSERKSRKIAFFLLINTTYMVVEFVAGFMSNSLGLISDACHMLFDCAALGIGLYASYISRLPANSQFNYGRGRFEVLSGYVNAVFLVLVGVLIVLESFERILDPQEISTNSLLTVSIGGLLVNVVGLVFFHDEHHHAHHGGGSCSHAHSHSHHNHQGDLSHDHVAHDHKLNAENHTCILDSRDSSDAKSHELHCCNHIGHHHDQNDDHTDGIKIRGNVSQSDHNFHGHQSDRHNHIHHGAGQVHENMSITKCDESLDTPLRSSQDHCHEGHVHNEDLGGKENCGQKDPSDFPHMSNHSHSHSSHSKVSLPEGKQVEDPREHHHIDHNMEGIFLHVLADTLGSVGVVISTLLIKYKGWLVADPACSIFISVMIISSVIPLLRNSAEILLQRVPRVHERDLKIALENVMRISGVCGVHNIHVWSFTNTDVVGTLLLHVSEGTDKVSARKHASDILHRAGIKDLTLQVDFVRD